MSEFKLINQYIDRGDTDESVVLGIGDDAAVMDVPEGFQIVQTMDTMVDGVHFDDRFSADALAHKLLHVNLSDIAAMAAVPKWATVALTLPSVDQQANEKWIDEFSGGLQSRSADIGLNLIGGDTTSGPFSVTMNLTGIVKKNEFLTRSDAKVGDDVYVSGYLGDAALALTKEGENNANFVERLLYPQARLSLGLQLSGLATACLDISDGLLADLTHICDKSHVSAVIDVEKIPLSESYKEHFLGSVNPDFALNGGDDYELCFTANPTHRKAIEALITQEACELSRIGHIVENDMPKTERVTTINSDGTVYSCQRMGWQHFESV